MFDYFVLSRINYQGRSLYYIYLRYFHKHRNVLFLNIVSYVTFINIFVKYSSANMIISFLKYIAWNVQICKELHQFAGSDDRYFQ
jgi:hypothetical protein